MYKVKRTDRCGLYMPLYFLLCVGTVVLRTIACFTQLDEKSGYFSGGLCRISNYIVLGGVLIFFSFALLYRKSSDPVPDFASPLSYIPGGVLCVALGFMGFYLAIVFFRALGGNETMLGKAPLTLSLITTALCAALAIGSLGYFFIRALPRDGRDTVQAGFCLVTVFFFACYASGLYFNTSSPLNNPAKITDLAAYLAAAVFFLYETRISLEREKWNLYGAFGWIAGLLCAYASVPALLFYLARGVCICDNPYSCVILFLVFVFVSCRMILFAHWNTIGQHPIVKRLIALGKVRIPQQPAVAHVAGDEQTAPAEQSEQQPSPQEEPAKDTQSPA